MSSFGHNSTSGLHTFPVGHEAIPMLFCSFLFGFPINVYAVWLICTDASGAAGPEFFALNLAAAEIVFCVFCAYVNVHSLLGMSEDTWGILMRVFVRFIFVSRPVFQGCICTERYLAVVFPRLFLRLKRFRYRLSFCLVYWLMIVVTCVLPSFTLSDRQALYLLQAGSFSSLFLMSYCSGHILCVLRRPTPGDGPRGGSARNGVKMKAFKVIVITLAFTGTTQLVKMCLVSPVLLDATKRMTVSIMKADLALGIVSGFITPLLYLHRAGKLPCVQF